MDKWHMSQAVEGLLDCWAFLEPKRCKNIQLMDSKKKLLLLPIRVYQTSESHKPAS